MWNAASGEEKIIFYGHNDTVLRAKFISENNVITASIDGKAIIWSSVTGEILREKSIGRFYTVDFSENGNIS